MAKSDFNNSVFVVKVYEHTTPSIKELVKEDTMWLCLSRKPTIK